MALSPQKVRGVVNSSLRIRWILLLAWIFALFGLLFAILPFVLNEARSDGLSILMFNTSSLVPVDGHPSPPNDDNPYQRYYLGAHDWYSVSFLWICKGYYAKAKGADSILTNSKKTENSTCQFRPIGTIDMFSPFHQMEMDYMHGWRPISPDALIMAYELKIPIVLWFCGLCCAICVFLFLPWTFAREKMLGTKNWCLIPTVIATVAFSLFVATICLLDGQIRGKNWINVKPDVVKGKMGCRFREFAVLAIMCMAMTFILGLMGWGGGAWLKDSLPIKFPDEEELEESGDRAANPGTDLLQELEPRPIENDNDLLFERFDGVHYEESPSEEFVGEPERGLPEYDTPEQTLPQSPAELTHLSPRPISDDDPFEEKRLRDEELQLRMREQKLLVQEAQRLADNEKRVKQLQALRMEDLNSRFGKPSGT